jgi:hypothetical protein
MRFGCPETSGSGRLQTTLNPRPPMGSPSRPRQTAPFRRLRTRGVGAAKLSPIPRDRARKRSDIIGPTLSLGQFVASGSTTTRREVVVV